MENQITNSWKYLLNDWQADEAESWFEQELSKSGLGFKYSGDFSLTYWLIGNKQFTTEEVSKIYPRLWAQARDRVDPHTNYCMCDNCVLWKNG